MSKKVESTSSVSELRTKLVKLTLDIKAGKEKNTSSVRLIKKQIAQLLTKATQTK